MFEFYRPDHIHIVAIEGSPQSSDIRMYFNLYSSTVLNILNIKDSEEVAIYVAR